MRIAIFGAGGVGGYYGARLAEAGEDVTFIARGRQLDALRSGGLVVESLAGDFTIDRVVATDQPSEVGAVDAVLVATKAWQVEEAAQAIRPLVGETTLVVPLQNGVEAADELAGILGPGPVLGGLTRIISYVVEPGRIRHAGIDPTIVIGERAGASADRCRPLAEALNRARGVSASIAADIDAEVWKKFAFICSWGGVGAVTRMPSVPCAPSPGSRQMLLSSLTEIAAVASAYGVDLPAGLTDSVMAFLDGLPDTSTPSMQRDIAEGRPSELDYQTGAVVRLGREKDVATPLNTFLYNALLPTELAARNEVPS